MTPALVLGAVQLSAADGRTQLIVLAIGIIFLAAICQAVVGFGFALVLVPLLSLFWDLKDTIAASVLLSPISSFFVVMELGRHARWRVVGGLTMGSVIGVPFGAALLVLTTPSFLRVLVASVILVSTLTTLRGVKLDQPRRPLVAALGVGAISGTLRSATSMGGPPVALYLLALRYPTAAFVGTNASFVLLSSVASIAGVAIAGRVSGLTLAVVALGVPALIAGGRLGRCVRARVSENTFRILVSLVLVLTGSAALGPVILRIGERL